MKIGNHLKIKNNLKLYIGEKGWSDVELARRVGCDPAYLARLCKNENANPTAKMMFSIAEELGVTVLDIWSIGRRQEARQKAGKK